MRVVSGGRASLAPRTRDDGADPCPVPSRTRLRLGRRRPVTVTRDTPPAPPPVGPEPTAIDADDPTAATSSAGAWQNPAVMALKMGLLPPNVSGSSDGSPIGHARWGAARQHRGDDSRRDGCRRAHSRPGPLKPTDGCAGIVDARAVNGRPRWRSELGNEVHARVMCRCWCRVESLP